MKTNYYSFNITENNRILNTEGIIFFWVTAEMLRFTSFTEVRASNPQLSPSRSFCLLSLINSIFAKERNSITVMRAEFAPSLKYIIRMVAQIIALTSTLFNYMRRW